jgi:hypothetical protein
MTNDSRADTALGPERSCIVPLFGVTLARWVTLLNDSNCITAHELELLIHNIRIPFQKDMSSSSSCEPVLLPALIAIPEGG